jgi:hypothetical protein
MSDTKLVVTPAPTREAGVTTHQHYHYGFRPGVGTRNLHVVLPCVLPTTPVGEYRQHPTGDSWCGMPAYLCEGPVTVALTSASWGMWPVCMTCLPGYEGLIVIDEMGLCITTGIADGMTAQQLKQRPRLEAIAVYARLSELLDRGYVTRTRVTGADQYVYALSPPVVHWFSSLPR